MKLTEINLQGYGRFSDTPATFECTRYHLPAPWDYVYTNGDVLLRLRHDGGGYLQLSPPGGPALFRQERGQTTPVFLTWIIPEGQAPGAGGAFSNFWKPNILRSRPDVEPEEYRCLFSPEAACYRLRHGDYLVESELWVPPSGAAMVMTVTVTNTGRKAHSCTVLPALKPHLASSSLAPWDVPHLYQTSAFCRLGSSSAFWLETRDPGGDPARRLRAAVLSDLQPDAFEVSADRFIGAGDWGSPQAVWNGRLALEFSPRAGYLYGKVSTRNAVVGQPPLAALAKVITLTPGRSFTFAVAFGKLPETAGGKLPPREEILKLARLLRPAERVRARRALSERYARLFSARQLHSPDEALNRYVNEFLPLQLCWVNMLDRGWPTGMRGTRDAAQDATGLVPFDPEASRRRLLEIFSLQRSDGWFLRQYSTSGRAGRHDYRPYVDTGLWCWELLRDYLVHTRDFALLRAHLGWLDLEGRSTLLEHARRLFQYYLRPENLGEHGLCKIREGDWNDSVNRAGVEQRGESVMVSAQLVLALEQAAELLAYLVARGRPASKTECSLPGLRRKFLAAAERLRAHMRKHALNRLGYFNGVFNDAGRWIFSPRDPDGKRRINNPTNSFAIIAGVVHGGERERVFHFLNSLKGPHGWRLFHPAIGHPPIARLGRIGQGDLAPGLGENGTTYNHGSQGFFGRAAWVAGRGGLLYQVLRYMFPYEQEAHPVEVARTAPYAMVNHWKEALGLSGLGGDTFLTGSISTSIRNCYQGMVGFRPDLEYLLLDPCLPADWDSLSAEVNFLGGKYRLEVSNPEHVECGVVELRLDGERISFRCFNKQSGRELSGIPISRLRPGGEHLIEVRLGPGPDRKKLC